MRRLLSLLALLVAGCVAYSPPLDEKAAAKPGVAYLGGIFLDVSTTLPKSGRSASPTRTSTPA